MEVALWWEFASSATTLWEVGYAPTSLQVITY